MGSLMASGCLLSCISILTMACIVECLCMGHVMIQLAAAFTAVARTQKYIACHDQDMLPLASWPHSTVMCSTSVIACCPCEAAADVRHMLVCMLKACFSIARQSANMYIREVVDDVVGCLLCYVMH